MKITVPEWPIWNKPLLENPELPVVNAVNIFDHTDGECLGYVFDDDGHVHFAVQLGQAVLAVEHIPEIYPATTVAFYQCRQNWINAIKDCRWIVDGLRAADIGCSPDCPKELLESNGADTDLAHAE